MKTKTQTNKGIAEFGFIIIILVIVFILWLFLGGPNTKESKEAPFFQADQGKVVPNKVLQP